MTAHKVTNHYHSGHAWASCTCGWSSPKLDAYHNYQMTDSAAAGRLHLKNEEAKKWFQNRNKS